MPPERLCEGLAAAARTRRAALLRLAEGIVGSSEVRIVEAPAVGVIAMRLATAAGELTLADVVVTTATVERAGRRGWGCVLGRDDATALAAAVCAAASGGADGARGAVTALAAAALAAERDQAAAGDSAVAATRVALG